MAFSLRTVGWARRLFKRLAAALCTAAAASYVPEDEAARNALNLAVQVDQIQIASIATRNDTLVIQFDLSISAP